MFPSTPSWLKVLVGVVGWWGGGPCDFGVTPSPLTSIWILDLGWTISIQKFRAEPESIVHDRSYGREPEDMVLEQENMLGVIDGSQRI